jgi:hypothetical protein
VTVTGITVPDGEMAYAEALAWLVSLGQTEFGAAGTLLTALKQPRALIWDGTVQITCDAKPARIFRAARLDQWSNPMNEATFEVVWPNGDIYANRDGQARLAETEAKATAPAIGGTWRHVTTEEN